VGDPPLCVSPHGYTGHPRSRASHYYHKKVETSIEGPMIAKMAAKDFIVALSPE
jgi:hypothetical protein